MHTTFKWLAATAAMFAAMTGAEAATIYVGSGTNASDNNSPNTINAPYRNLSKAASVVHSGDVVQIMNGTYAPVALTVANVTWQAYPGHTPEIVSTGWHAIEVQASYQTIDGLILTGNNDHVTLAQAEADQAAAGYGSPLYNGNAITLDNRKNPVWSHHLTVRNCTIRKFGGGGIGMIQTDFAVIEYNKVYENAWYGRYAGSGISLFTSNLTGAAGGYRNVIRGNLVWNNKSLVKWKNPPNNAAPLYSDGNGIIMDISATDYSGRTLITDNVSVANGGGGIHIYSAKHVDVVNNTAYGNGTKVGYPDIDANHADDVKFYNNIMYARNGGTAVGNNASTNVVFGSNIYYNGVIAMTPGSGDLSNVDPLFVAPGVDLLTANFRVKGNSQAINTGYTQSGLTSTLDQAKVARPVGGVIDRGAYEALLPRLVSATAVSGRKGVPLSFSVYAYNYPTSYTAGPLPAGLSFNPANGAITGTPTVYGTFSVTVGAVNNAGSDSDVVVFTISPPTT